MLYEGNNIISTFRKGNEAEWQSNLPKVTELVLASIIPYYLQWICQILLFSRVFLRLMYQVYGSFYSFVCRKTRAITILKASNTLPIHPQLVYQAFFTETHANVFFLQSAGWRRVKKAALPGMWTILSDALMSLAEPKAFQGRCTLPSLVNHRLPPGRGIFVQKKRSLVQNCTWSTVRDKGSSFNRNPNNN